MTTTVDKPAATAEELARATSKRIVQDCIHLTRWAIYHGRDPDPRYEGLAQMEWDDFAFPMCDPIAMEAKDDIYEKAQKYGMVDRDAGAFDAFVMSVLLDVVYEVFWLGLTHGDVRIMGECHMPLRLIYGSGPGNPPGSGPDRRSE